VERLRENANLEHLLASEKLKEGAGKAVQVVLQGTVSVVGGAAGILMNLCFTLFTLYYLFRDGRRIVEKLPGFLPLDPARGRVMVARTGEVLRASLYGVMVIAAVQGAMGGLAFWALGVPSPFVWGVVMTLFATIPMLGTFVVWAPAAAWLLLGGEHWRAGVLAVWGAVVIGSVDNFLRPKLVGSKVEMHELLVFFSVLGGLSVFGILGILVGPAVVAVTFGLLEALRQSDAPPPAGADPPPAS
jgi:predicted PurR-regulated permease PerM